MCGDIGHFLWSISRGECPAPNGAQVGGPDARVAKFAPELSLITIFQSSGNSGLSWVPGLIYRQWGRDRGVCHRELSIFHCFQSPWKWSRKYSSNYLSEFRDKYIKSIVCDVKLKAIHSGKSTALATTGWNVWTFFPSCQNIMNYVGGWLVCIVYSFYLFFWVLKRWWSVRRARLKKRIPSLLQVGQKKKNSSKMTPFDRGRWPSDVIVCWRNWLNKRPNFFPHWTWNRRQGRLRNQKLFTPTILHHNLLQWPGVTGE